MSFKLKLSIIALGLALFSAFTLTNAQAHPLEELGPDSDLYQRVKKLENYNLLDPQDRQVLDEGKYVTRLELAFYTEKAKAMFEKPQLGNPGAVSVPTAVPTTAPTAAISPVPTIAEMMPTATAIPSIYVDPQVRMEIDQLLKELKNESADLRNHWVQEDERIKDRQKEIDDLNAVQDSLNDNFRKSNGKMKMPTFDSRAVFNFENITLTGPSIGPTVVPTLNNIQQAPIPSANAIRGVQIDEVRMTTDLGGVGSFTLGLGAALSDSNASVGNFNSTYSFPASVYVFAPDFATQFDGPLGQWNTHVAVEAYPGALSFGDFSRGVQPSSLKLDQNPFDIRRATDDKNGKIWDDYMTNLSAVQENLSSPNIQSTYDRVFDGIYGVGNNLPFIGGDTRLIVLAGRMGTSNIQSQRWEEGAKLDSSLIIPELRGDISTEWVNDNFATDVGAQLNVKSYQATLNYSKDLLNVNVEAGFSSLYTGTYGANQSNDFLGLPTTTALEAPAGQASISYYPLSIFYSAISDSYANVQSKVAMAGVHFDQYGLSNSASTAMDAYGWIGEADTLVSDRYGWRVNFGWDGRQQTWMKKWPSFLDAIVVNLNVSQKQEYVAEYDQIGDNVVEAINMTSLYYPDDEGLWGLNFWGGYGISGIDNWYAVRQNYITNIEAYRNDGSLGSPGSTGIGSGDDVRYQYTLSSERIPLIIPISNNGTLIAPGQAVTFNSKTNTWVQQGVSMTSSQGMTLNQYYVIPSLKTYNYLTLTTKVEFNKLLGITSPIYGSFFFTDNNVAASTAATAVTYVSGGSSVANASPLGAGTQLFDQTVFDFAGMVQIFRNVNLLGDYGLELWNSMYTYPYISYRTDSIGAGFAYDIPWGGAKWEFRYKHFVFSDKYVPLNDYQADQLYSTVRFLF